VSGQFLIDSEASLRGEETRMEESKPAAAIDTHHGHGKVEHIGKDEITLSHGPIASLQWGPMTMGFKLPAEGLPQTIAVGSAVDFEFRAEASGYRLTRIAPASPTTEGKP